MNRYEAAAREVRAGRSFLVAVHVNPDGDAIGSALALAAGMRKLKKKVKIYSQDPVPGFLRFLPSADRISHELKGDERFDAAFLVDCADRERVGPAFARHGGWRKLIVLDHHALSGRSGEINVVETKAASSGVVVLSFLKKLRVPITREIALSVYCTLVADTGNFRYSNTDAGVLALASGLVDKGVSPWQVSKNLYENWPVQRFTLLGEVLRTLEVSTGGRLAVIALTQEMLQRTGASSELAEEFINYPRSIDSVEVAVQFRETEDGKVKISFRSKDKVDVARLAARFGGGGHQKASGCTIEGTLEAARALVLPAVREVLNS